MKSMQQGKVWSLLIWLNSWGIGAIILAFYTAGIFS